LSTALVLGPFEDEDEEIGIASDVVKLKVEEPVTPGSLRARGDRVRWYAGNLFRRCMHLGPPVRKPQA